LGKEPHTVNGILADKEDELLKSGVVPVEVSEKHADSRLEEDCVGGSNLQVCTRAGNAGKDGVMGPRLFLKDGVFGPKDPQPICLRTRLRDLPLTLVEGGGGVSKATEVEEVGLGVLEAQLLLIPFSLIRSMARRVVYTWLTILCLFLIDVCVEEQKNQQEEQIPILRGVSTVNFKSCAREVPSRRRSKGFVVIPRIFKTGQLNLTPSFLAMLLNNSGDGNRCVIWRELGWRWCYIPLNRKLIQCVMN
jgi:hypothetical protein